jgi:glutathione peroxidase
LEENKLSVYDYAYTSIENKPVGMSEYQGKVLLIVNTASKCGFTPQYQGLQALYDQYKDQGFAVIGFPCNQFMEQEPGNDAEIAEFCSLRFGVTFPLSQKVDVRDENAIPLFQYLTSQKGFDGFGKGVKAKTMELMLKSKYKRAYADPQVKWNFTKFLVDREGKVFGRYEPTVEPKDMTADIERLLQK